MSWLIYLFLMKKEEKLQSFSLCIPPRIYISGKLSAFQAEDKSSILFIRFIST